MDHDRTWNPSPRMLVYRQQRNLHVPNTGTKKSSKHSALTCAPNDAQYQQLFDHLCMFHGSSSEGWDSFYLRKANHYRCKTPKPRAGSYSTRPC